MRAAVIREYGGPDVLVSEDAPDPRPGPHQAVVAVEAAAVGHFDVDLRMGVSRLDLAFPHILGSEAVGRIAELPAGYAGPLAVGDRVMVPEEEWCGVCEACRAGRENTCDEGRMLGVQRPGTYAELLTARAADLLPIDDGLPAESWAAVQVAFGTAWHMLVTRAALAAGERVLVTGAAGGVGSAAIQIADLAGATVIAAARGEAKLARLGELGAAATVDYAREPLAEAVLEATAGRGVDVVLEHVGGDVLVQSAACLAKGGRIVTCGAHAGEVVPLDVIQLFRREQTLIGSRTCTMRELQDVIRLVGERRLVPVVDSVFPLADAAAAHRRLQSREHVGKVVIVPRQTR